MNRPAARKLVIAVSAGLAVAACTLERIYPWEGFRMGVIGNP